MYVGFLFVNLLFISGVMSFAIHTEYGVFGNEVIPNTLDGLIQLPFMTTDEIAKIMNYPKDCSQLSQFMSKIYDFQHFKLENTILKVHPLSRCYEHLDIDTECFDIPIGNTYVNSQGDGFGQVNGHLIYCDNSAFKWVQGKSPEGVYVNGDQQNCEMVNQDMYDKIKMATLAHLKKKPEEKYVKYNELSFPLTMSQIDSMKKNNQD